jgi:hypothetical protein
LYKDIQSRREEEKEEEQRINIKTNFKKRGREDTAS